MHQTLKQGALPWWNTQSMVCSHFTYVLLVTLDELLHISAQWGSKQAGSVDAEPGILQVMNRTPVQTLHPGCREGSSLVFNNQVQWREGGRGWATQASWLCDLLMLLFGGGLTGWVFTLFCDYQYGLFCFLFGPYGYLKCFWKGPHHVV